jgi:hypothetical protein
MFYNSFIHPKIFEYIFWKDYNLHFYLLFNLSLTVSADKSERSLNDDYILPVCAIAIQVFSVYTHVSLDIPKKISLT